MTKARFEIAFEGDAFDQGEIDVRDLAPTLLAFGDLVQAANKALNGDRADAKLKLTATEEGSFVAALAMDVSWVADMLDAVTANPDRVMAADQLMDLLIKAGGAVGSTSLGAIGFIAAVRKMGGKRPEKVEAKGDGTTQITVNNSTIVVDDPTVKLLQDLPSREALEKFGKKAEKVSGLEKLRIGADFEGQEALRVSKSDLKALQIPEIEEEPTVEKTHRTAWLKIVSVHFHDGYKWRFSDGGERPFTAEMEDQDFLDKVHKGDVAFSENDAIHCRLREEQSLNGGQLAKVTFVEEVMEHRPGARQMNLL